MRASVYPTTRCVTEVLSPSCHARAAGAAGCAQERGGFLSPFPCYGISQKRARKGSSASVVFTMQLRSGRAHDRVVSFPECLPFPNSTQGCVMATLRIVCSIRERAGHPRAPRPLMKSFSPFLPGLRPLGRRLRWRCQALEKTSPKTAAGPERDSELYGRGEKNAHPTVLSTHLPLKTVQAPANEPARGRVNFSSYLLHFPSNETHAFPRAPRDLLCLPTVCSRRSPPLH